MFYSLGRLVARYWYVFVIAWGACLGLALAFGADWEAVTRSGEVNFLPADAPSRRGEELFQKAFPGEYAASTIAVVIARAGEKLQPQDRHFVDKVLAPALEDLALNEKDSTLVTRIRTPADEEGGILLVSPDKQAALIVLELEAAFQDRRSNTIVGHIEGVLSKLRNDGKVPSGLAMNITGSATAGRDLVEAEDQTARSIQTWTIGIVIGLLLLMYRAPVVALIPLVTVAVAVKVSMALIGVLAGFGILPLSRDIGIFITVLVYGAGVDYCLFLLGRYHEELEHGIPDVEALADSIGHVGVAVSASAGTVIAGIAMLSFARFGKLHEAGIGIPIALSIGLVASLTLSPALLRLFGKCAFWPQPVGQECLTAKPARLVTRVFQWNMLPNYWQRFGPALLRHPGIILTMTLAVMFPFALLAVRHYRDQNFNPLSDLPAGSPSVAGTQVLAQHFPPGMLGPATVLLHDDQIDFRSKHGVDLITQLSNTLRAQKDQLDLADIRSIATPLGISPAAEAAVAQVKLKKEEVQAALQDRALSVYVSHVDGFQGTVTRLDLTFVADPLSQAGLDDLGRLEHIFQSELPAGLRGARIDYVGSSASIYDLSSIKQADQQRIEILVSLVVFLLLLLVFRRLVVSLYLIFSVLFSYLATLGVTFLLFGWLDGAGYTGLDWKVPIFLFTILVAVGEDYNIFLLTRVQEEQKRHGLMRGVPIAVSRTGRVISSCGLLMAGTFASLLSGSLNAMHQLGFALAFGILLDTLVVRPILVPSFLLVLQHPALGSVGRYMAFGQHLPGARLTAG
jgi:putative drug exporter of the RND superfamily